MHIRINKLKKILRNIFKLILPPIFFPKNINEIFNFLIRGENMIEYEKSFYNRQAFINKSLNKFKNPKYLEIGVDKNLVFNCIPLKMSDKYGVDPKNGGNFKMTSDDFFLKNKDIKFDVIFIDGLHHYEQCQKDTINSINSLNKNGIIFIHDLLPQNKLEEFVPQKQYSAWKGDVWKVAVELKNSLNCTFKIINIDSGIGILKVHQNFQYKIMPELKDLRYDSFLKYYSKLDIINSEEALNFIELN
jgi:hypothetical protein